MKLHLRRATSEDLLLFFRWKNDPVALANSFDSNPVNLDDHSRWFLSKLTQENAMLLVLENEDQQPVGQVRFDTENNLAVIGITVDPDFRGQGFGARMLQLACSCYFERYPENSIQAYIKTSNTGSYKIFTAAGFSEPEQLIISDHNCFRLTLRKNK